MSVPPDEYRLGGPRWTVLRWIVLRWIVLRGPDRQAFRAFGEHVREEMTALAQASALAQA